MKLTLELVKSNNQIKDFIEQTEKYLDALGYTDHGFRHINIVADRCRSLAKKIGLNAKDQELAAVAGYCHDMGNFLGRTQHHYWAAMLFSQIYINEVDNPEDLSVIIQAMVSHDKYELKLVNKIAAILVLADKSDVHRTRVKNPDSKNMIEDVHERVNFAATDNSLEVNNRKKEIVLKVKIDTKITEPIDYFDIFLDRMMFCRQAAAYLDYKFVFYINDFRLS